MSQNEKNIQIKIENGVILTDEQKRLLQLFVEYCQRALKLNHGYACYLVKNREAYGIETTAVCMYSKKKIIVYCAGRLLADVLRSIAHELTHIRQHEHGQTPDLRYLHFSSDMEDGANELAGKLLNAFSEVIGSKAIYDEHISAK